MKSISIIFFLLINFYGYSQQDNDVKSFSLQQAIEYAFDHHPDVLNAVADEKRAMAQRNEIIGIGLPQINGSFDITNYVKIPTSLIPAQIFDQNAPAGEFIPVQFGTKYNTTAAIQANQLLFSGDYIVALQSSGTFIGLSEKSTIKTKTDLALAVSKSYYLLLINQEQIQLVNANFKSLEELKNETTKMFEAGFVEKIDLDRLSVSYNNLKVQQNNLRKLIALGYASLKFQIGMPLDTKLEITDTLDQAVVNGLDLEIGSFSYDDRIEYQLLITQKKLASQSLKLNQVSYLPSLVLYGNLSTQAQGNELFGNSTRWFPIGLVGLSLNVPVFDGLQKKYRIQQSRIDVLKLENNINNAQRGIDLELESALVMLENSLANIESQQENISLAKSVFETASKKYSLGTGTSMEVVEAETALKESQTNYYNALYEAIVAKLNYEKAKGTLIE